MKRNLTKAFAHLALLGLCAAHTLSVHAATLRCGSQLISTGDRPFEVEQKCGPPVSQTVLGSSETYDGSYRRGERVRIEEWVYGPDHGMYQYLRFVGGRLTEINSERGR